MTHCRFLYAALALLCFSAQSRLTSCNAQLAGGAGIEIASIDARTRWAFRTISPVIVASPIIRLEDVVKPLDPNMAGWQRLRRSPVGLVPLGGHPMTIQRDRLAKAIHDAEATPRAIDWIGPLQIKVIYREAQPSDSRGQAAFAKVAYADDASTPIAGKKPVPSEQLTPLSISETDRILHWIELAIERQHPSIAETYRVEIDRRQAGFAPLRYIAGVTSIEFYDQVREGAGRFHVVARSSSGPIEADVEVKLSLHPTVVMPRKSFPRGHRIEAGDLVIRSLPEEEIEHGVVIDPEEVIGMEVRGSVRANRPILYSDVGPPILIHRGDLIEIRVVGGGITITTNAKSLGDGAVAELIEIETMQPRKRLVARVVQPGMVEIITRAPQVKP